MDPAAKPDPLRVPPPPRQPSARARELVFKYQGAHLALLIVGSIFMFVGGVLGVAFDWHLPADLALATGSRAATGHVVAAELELHVRVNDRHPTRLTFTYDVDGKQHQAQSQTTDAALIANAQPGQDVPIEVATLDADWARVQGTTMSILGLYGLLILIFPALGLVLATVAVRGRRRQIRAFTDGQPIVARVTFSGLNTRVRINGRHPHLVRWEFSLEGRVFQGSISSLQLAHLEPLMAQKEVLALYIPENPKINTCWVD